MNPRKNILIFGYSYGTQFVDICNQHAQLFDKNHYKVTVAYLTGEPDATVRERTQAEEILFLGFTKKAVRGLKIRAIWQLLQLCKQRSFQVVICHRYKPTYIMLWIAQLCRIPLLFFVMHEFGALSSVARKGLIAGLCKKNMLFAGVSNAIRDDLRHHLAWIPPERIITLYNAIDVEQTEKQLFSREQAREKLHLPQDTFIFGNIARLSIKKDQKTLLHAFAAVRKNCPNSKLVIMGIGSLEAELKKEVATLGIENAVIFMGFIPQAYRYLPALDCFVLSSVQEAFGMVLLEAMVAKVPVIATRVHGIPEVIGNAGWLVEARDVNALAATMQQLYSASAQQRKTWGETGYQHAVSQFSMPCFRENFWGLDCVRELKWI